MDEQFRCLQSNVNIKRLKRQWTHFIDDVLCTALDSAYGGSLYWISQTFILNGKKADYGVEYKYEVVSKGGTLVVVEDETDEPFQLTRDAFEKAVAQWSASRGIYTMDASVIDANDADVILQLALFGEVVYS